MPKNNPLRILILTQYYSPETGAPQARLAALAKSLQKKGFEVAVLTAMPSYPIGRIFPGYNGLFRKEVIDGVKVLRSFIIPTAKTTTIPRLVQYFSFCISALLFSFCLPKFDYLMTESPPIFLGMTGLFISKMKRARWILNISDLWPLSAAELNVIRHESLAYRTSEKLEISLYRKAWLVSGQSRMILENIRARVPEVNTYHLPNGADPSLYSRPLEDRADSQVVIMYAGLHGLAQGLEQVIEAAKELQDNPHLHFQLIGEGPTKHELVELANHYQLDNVTFSDGVYKEEIPGVLEMADILLVPLKIALTGAVPSKLYEAMAAGKPVIFIGSGEAAEIVTNAQCGVVVPPSRIDLLVENIRSLSENHKMRKIMGENGREAVKQFYDLQKIGENFANFLITQSSNK